MKIKRKSILTFILLLFVAVSVIYALVNEVKLVNEQTEIAQGVTVYYFHGNLRCSSCLTIQRFTVGSLQTAFSSKIAEDKLLIEIVNIDKAENKHFLTDFELTSNTVVVRAPSGSWRKLDRVWDLTADSIAFYNYITSEVEIDLERVI